MIKSEGKKDIDQIKNKKYGSNLDQTMWNELRWIDINHIFKKKYWFNFDSKKITRYVFLRLVFVSNVDFTG